MSTGVLDTLRAARTLLSDPARWCQNASARRPDGGVSSSYDKAYSFCALGAVEHLSRADYPAVSDLLDGLTGDIVEFNDSHTHAEVLDVFDTLIETLESQQ